jgi:hypothetical protein
MRTTALLLLLVISCKLCLAQQSNNWWETNLYTNWTRVYQFGSVNNSIAINNYAFFFTTNQTFVGKPLPQIPVTTTQNPNVTQPQFNVSSGLNNG